MTNVSLYHFLFIGTCRSALGMNDKRIPDNQLAASSVYSSDPLTYGPQNARYGLASLSP